MLNFFISGVMCVGVDAKDLSISIFTVFGIFRRFVGIEPKYLILGFIFMSYLPILMHLIAH